MQLQADASDLIRSLEKVTKNLSKELGIISWNVAKRGKSTIAKEVGKELAVPQKIIKEQIKSKRLSNKLDAETSISKSSRLALKSFGARQVAKGVSYKISKREGRKLLAGAFQGPRPGLMKASWRGNAFKRVGKSRLPIYKPMGPSPWGVMLGDGEKRVASVARSIKSDIAIESRKRLKYLQLKNSGVI